MYSAAILIFILEKPTSNGKTEEVQHTLKQRVI